MVQGKRKVVAVVDDLLFTVKISDMAKRTGLPVEFVKNPEDVLEAARANPLLIIFDLNTHALDPIQIIRALKSDPGTKGVSLLGYVSHVHGDLKQQAHDAGCDMVMARSAFSQNLPMILKRHANAA
jgi:CheY-like chemotaxis protein